jgi:transposase
MEKANHKKYTFFIGIDVSKDELDYAVMQGSKLLFHVERNNRPDDILQMVNELKLLPKFTITKSLFCMEHTGLYCNHLLSILKKVKANIVIENALQIKNSMGLLRGKHDKIDSIRIANYAYTNREKLRLKAQKRIIINELSTLLSLRNRLMAVEVALKTPIKEQHSFVKQEFHRKNVAACKNSIEAIKNDLSAIEKSIEALVESDSYLKRLLEIITSIPFIGKITAFHVIISTNEFKDINCPKKFACFCGVAPFPKESGKIAGKARISHIANKKIKSLLHICALGASRYDAELKQYYERKVSEGKAKMAVLNALRYKLIQRIFACVKQDRLFIKEYIGKLNTASELRTTLS